MLPAALLLLVPVVLYHCTCIHTWFIMTVVCMIAFLSIVRSKLSDLYEWLH